MKYPRTNPHHNFTIQQMEKPVKNQSKAFHIWKAIEMAAKARTEAVPDNKVSDAATLGYVSKLLEDLENHLNGDNLIFQLLQLLGNQRAQPGLQAVELEKWRDAGRKIAMVVQSGRHEILPTFDASLMGQLKSEAIQSMRTLCEYVERSQSQSKTC